MFDAIVIGGGPAGVSASLYIKRANLSVKLFYLKDSNVSYASKIDNYYGFESGISGKDLYENGINQAKNLGVEISSEEVIKIENLGKSFKVITNNNEYEALSIVLATGDKKNKPNIEGIDRFTGKGVSYCAICDAFFYRGKDVAVIGNGNFALSEAEELKNLVKSVTILTNGETLESAEFDVIDKKIKSINGDEKVRSVTFEDDEEKAIDGVFIALGQANASDFAKTLGIVENGDNIKVNEKMETNIKGIYACGNITGGLKQISKAVYDGTIAGISCIEYVRNLKKEN